MVRSGRRHTPRPDRALLGSRPRVGLGGGVEANPGPVSQAGDPLGPQHRRKGAKHARQTPGCHNRHPVDDGLTPGDRGAVDGHGWQHHHLGVGQDPGGLVGLELHGAQGGGERVAAMPQSPGWVELEAARILLGVDHEQPTGPDQHVVEVGLAARDSQVVQDRPALPRTGRLAGSAAAGAGGLGAWPVRQSNDGLQAPRPNDDRFCA